MATGLLGCVFVPGCGGKGGRHRWASGGGWNMMEPGVYTFVGLWDGL